jgi:uncharacterized protein YdaT
MSERQACSLIFMPLSSKRYQAKPKLLDEEVKSKLIELAQQNIRFGYRRLKS